EHGGVERSDSGDREVPAFMKAAQRAGSDLGGRPRQKLGAFLVRTGHAPARAGGLKAFAASRLPPRLQVRERLGLRLDLVDLRLESRADLLQPPPRLDAVHRAPVAARSA